MNNKYIKQLLIFAWGMLVGVLIYETSYTRAYNESQSFNDSISTKLQRDIQWNKK